MVFHPKFRRAMAANAHKPSSPSRTASSATTGTGLGLENPNLTSSSTRGGDFTENSPLLPRRHDSTNSTATSVTASASPVRDFFLSKGHTPGQESPNRLVKWPANVWHVTKLTLLESWINVLLVFVPLGIVAGKLEWPSAWIFTLNFIAIVPLAGILSFATEEIAKQVGDTLGGLINATFGNAVELIVSIVALQAGEIEIVQASMLGSILSNLLLVLGMCFFLGGIYNNMRDGPSGQGTEQSFTSATAQTTSGLMALSCASMIIPAALYGILDRADDQGKENSILFLSRGTAIILLILYCVFMYFQLRSHSNLFIPMNDDSDLETGASISSPTSDSTAHENTPEEEEGLISGWAAAAILVAVTLVISACADYLVDSIDDIVATGKISKTFIGLILIPIVGNAAEHATACVMAVKNKMTLATGVALGSSIQISLMVTPLLVILGWIMDRPMTLHFETFETIAFALSVIVVTYTLQDGKSNYLEGAMLVGLYVIIALAFWASPTDALDKSGGGLGWFLAQAKVSS